LLTCDSDFAVLFQYIPSFIINGFVDKQLTVTAIHN